MRTLRWTVGLSLLALQVGAIGYARFVPTRYFCWAPYDMQTDYRLTVTVNGRRLTPDEVRRRYGRPARGTDNRSYQHVIDIVEGTEGCYHPGDCTEVTMAYSVNGRPEQTWHYRRP